MSPPLACLSTYLQRTAVALAPGLRRMYTKEDQYVPPQMMSSFETRLALGDAGEVRMVGVHWTCASPPVLQVSGVARAWEAHTYTCSGAGAGEAHTYTYTSAGSHRAPTWKDIWRLAMRSQLDLLSTKSSRCIRLFIDLLGVSIALYACAGCHLLCGSRRGEAGRQEGAQGLGERVSRINPSVPRNGFDPRRNLPAAD